MPSRVSITPEVADILARGRCDHDTYFLPEGQLDRRLYEQVDRVLRALGARWDRRARAHVGVAGLHEALAQALETLEAVDQVIARGFFPTPRAVADRVWTAAQVEPQHRVLEPSAGDGDLLAPLDLDVLTLTLVECAEVCVPTLRRRFPGATVDCADFLTWRAPHVFDRIVMNPPFGKGIEIEHLLKARAVLAPGGRVVAIMPASFEWAQRPVRTVRAREALLTAGGTIESLPARSFAASGTLVSTVLAVWPA